MRRLIRRDVIANVGASFDDFFERKSRKLININAPRSLLISERFHEKW